MENQKAKHPKTLMEAIQYFSNEAICVEYLCKLRYDLSAPCCPYCGSLNVGKMNTRPKFQCREKECRKQFSMKKGTIMEDSPVPLTKWMVAMWQVCNCKNGISSYELGRALGVTQTTAWFMLHRIRVAMKSGTFMKLSGECEADETLLGARARYMSKSRRLKAGITTSGRSGTANKTIVLGMVQRGGSVVAKTVDNTRRNSLLPEILKTIDEGTTLYTDALKSYEPLGMWYDHSTIDHRFEFVKGAIHTNTMENFWSLLKRTIKGTYVHIAPFHCDKYLDEQAFRYNNRKTNDANRFMKVASQLFGKRLTYKELTGVVVS